MAKELFYSEKDGMLFLITGYDNPMDVDSLIKTLQKGKEKLQSFLPKSEKGEIKTDMITKSSRYKSMRVFFLKTKHVPKEAYFLEIQKDVQENWQWTMQRWLEN